MNDYHLECETEHVAADGRHVFSFTLIAGPSRSLSLKLSATGVYAPQMAATSHISPLDRLIAS